MKSDWNTLFFAGIFAAALSCNAQEARPQWDCAGDHAYTVEDDDGEATQEQHCHHNHDVFFSPHFYDHGYREPTPLPDWPGANNVLSDELSR